MSEFLDNLLQKIWMSIYQGLWDTLADIFNWMQGVQQNYIFSSRELITQSPRDWNGAAFSFVKGVAHNAVIPIAGCIITFVFCWQLISMVQEGNQMHNIKPEAVLLLMMKLGICLLVCSKSFEIVNGMFDLASSAVQKIPLNTLTVNDQISLDGLLERETEDGIYTFGMCGRMLMYVFVTLIAVLIIYVISLTIYIRVNIWYLELLIYASASPMPFSMFMNKEWGQVGTNYVRKMLAMSFEGFFMLIAFGLYNALSSHALNQAAGGNAYLLAMATVIGCGAGLVLIINKAGAISASVFNAH